ncbi:hypothetical protein OQA88_5631 [Cercophora sp. LCS_1]
MDSNRLSSPIQMVPEDRPKDTEQQRAVVRFLRRELQSSWHPSFHYTTVLIRNVADSLHAFSSQDVASMRISCTKEVQLPGGNVTIRQVIEKVRVDCRYAVDQLDKDMDKIAGYCEELHGEIGPLRRLLRVMFADSKPPEGMMEDYVQQACRIQKELVNRQAQSVSSWYSLATYVSSIKKALDEQLETLKDQRAALEKRLKDLQDSLVDPKAELDDSQQKCARLRSDVRDLTQERDGLGVELRGVRRRIQKLEDDMTFLPQEVEDLREAIDADEQELEQDEKTERDRQQRWDKENQASEQGALWAAFDYCWGSAETQKRRKWDQSSRQRRNNLDRQKSRVKEMQQTMRANTNELKSLKTRKGHLEDGRIGRLDDEISTLDTGKAEEAVTERSELVRKIEADIDAVKVQIIEVKDDYEALVPALRANFSTMENSACFTYSAYSHTLEKLEEYGPILTSIARGVQGWRSNGVDPKDVIETTINLRYRYIVAQHMSRSCSTVCKTVFAQGLSEIAHLGTVPSTEQSGDGFASSSRRIQYQTASRDIDKMYVYGAQATRGFERMNQRISTGRSFDEGLVADEFTDTQRACLEALHEALRDVINSTPPRTLWPSRMPRMLMWTGLKRQRAIEEWANTTLGRGEGTTDQKYNRPQELWGGRTLETPELHGDRGGNDEVGGGLQQGY